LTDKDSPNRGPADGDNSSSSVEKAAERMSRDPNASATNAPDNPQSEANGPASSIERFLDATEAPLVDGDSGTQLPAADIGPERDLQTPNSGPAATSAASDIPSQKPMPAAYTHARPEASDREVQNPDIERAAHNADAAPDYRAQSSDSGPQQVSSRAPAETYTPPPEYNAPPAEGGGYTADRDQPPHPAARPANMAAPTPRKGLFKRKNKGTKPWHRDHPGNAAPEGAADAMYPPAGGEHSQNHGQMPEVHAEADIPQRRGPLRMVWSVVRFLLIGKKRTKTPKGSARPRGGMRMPRISGLSHLGKIGASVPAFARKMPGLRRLRRSAVSAVNAVSESASGSQRPNPVETAMETRRSAAGSHIYRPLDMSRRVGRSVEIDMEKIRTAGMVTPFGERTHIAEEFRLIKRPLLLNAFEKGPNAIRNGNVIMVASSRSGEGKTFMAVNLAMSIASERDLTVLLIDADVAKPDIPNVLGFEADLGLVDLIADDRIDMSEVIMRTNIENLSVMPAGRPHHLATELLASERMGNLVSELSLRYPERVVIMDSPPALLSSVAGVLALNVGQTLFVVEAERTSQTAVDSAIGLVSACKNINLLLNKSRPLGGGERFGSYQSSYY